MSKGGRDNGVTFWTVTTATYNYITPYLCNYIHTYSNKKWVIQSSTNVRLVLHRSDNTRFCLTAALLLSAKECKYYQPYVLTGQHVSKLILTFYWILRRCWCDRAPIPGSNAGWIPNSFIANTSIKKCEVFFPPPFFFFLFSFCPSLPFF